MDIEDYQMFQDMTKLFEQSVESFQELAKVQQEMLQRITNQQIEYTQQCIQATMNQANSLQGLKSPEEFIEAQKEYTQRLEAALKAAAEQNMKTVQNAQEEIQKIASQSMGGK
jgi:hypothetical protein